MQLNWEITKVARVIAQLAWTSSVSIKRVVAYRKCGTEVKLCEGDADVMEPGHDGFVERNEPVVLYEFSAAAIEYFSEFAEYKRLL